jgi:DNA recombination protein RmuC
LHSLQVGFQTLAIQKRSSEVRSILGAVKTEFGRFADILEGVQRNLNAASNKIGDATEKTRSIEQRLKDVESLPGHETPKYLTDGKDSAAVEVIDETIDGE